LDFLDASDAEANAVKRIRYVSKSVNLSQALRYALVHRYFQAKYIAQSHFEDS
jgi:hypothetical protein